MKSSSSTRQKEAITSGLTIQIVGAWFVKSITGIMTKGLRLFMIIYLQEI